jgi:hypothetical protein
MNTNNRARAAFATGESVNINAGSGDTFDIQWMPPGAQSPCCFVGDEARTLSFTVRPQHAQAFNVQLQRLRSLAAAGQGDEPFIDFNHEDGRASGRPTEFYYGGEDPKSGGIRLRGTWTASGKAAVKGPTPEFTRFSPEWYFDDNQEPVAIGVNLGGLVNRAAFTNIQRVTAKSPRTEPASPLERAIAAAIAPLMTKIKSLEKAYGCAPTKDAEIQADDPRAILARASTPQVGAIRNPLPLANHPFLEQARALAASQGISEANAQVAIARANYPLYNQYLASLHQTTLTKASGKPANNGQEGFLTLVQAKQAGGMSFDAAVDFVVRTRPDLAESYRGSYITKAH